MSILSYKAGNNVYTALESELRRKILSGALRDGQSLYSETQLARNYRISRSSVRTALANLEREGLLRKVRGSGTFVAPVKDRRQFKPPADIKGKQILFLSFSSSFSETTFATNDMYQSIFNGFTRIFQPKGYSLLFSHAGVDEQPVINMEDPDIGGTIFHGRPSIEFYRKYLCHRPCIGINHVNPAFDCSWVKNDNFSLAYQMVAHLKDLGHRRIGFVSNESEEPVPKERFEGFLKAMHDLNLNINPQHLFLWQRPRINGELAHEHSVPDYRKYLYDAFRAPDPPDALACIDDWRAYCVKLALEKMNIKVPEDVSLIGSCTSPKARNCNFTSLFVRSEELYAMAAKLLLEQIDAPGTMEKITVMVRPELIIGDSTQPRKQKV